MDERKEECRITPIHEKFDALAWPIKAGDDGLVKDAVLIGVLSGDKLVSVLLCVPGEPAAEPGYTVTYDGE